MDRPCARFGGWFKEETQLRHRFAFPLSHDNTSNTVSMNENPSTNCTADIDTRVRREYTTVFSVLWCCMQHNVHGTCIRSICYCRLWLKTRCKLVDYGCCSGMDWLLELHVLRQALFEMSEAGSMNGHVRLSDKRWTGLLGSFSHGSILCCSAVMRWFFPFHGLLLHSTSNILDGGGVPILSLTARE